MMQEKQTTSAEETNIRQQTAADEIDIKEIIVKVWQKRRFIFKVTGISLLIGVFIAFTSPVSYTASCTVVPQTGQKSNSSLGGLAAMAGISLGSSTSGEALSPSVYPNIIKSAPFSKELMNTSITIKKSGGKPITLYEYYTNEKYQSVSVWGVILKYTIGLPGVILSGFGTDDSSKSDVSRTYPDSITGEIVALTPQEERVMKAIQSNILFTANSKEGYISIGYTFSEPEATAEIAQQIYRLLEKYVKTYVTQRETHNLEFVEKSYQEARAEFMKKQAALASFQDMNRDLASAMSRSTERRLNSEYDVAFSVYTELAKQLEQAKLEVKKTTPALTIIEPVVIPHVKSAPKRPMIMAGFLFLGLALSVGWVLMKPFWHEITKGIKILN